MDKKMGELSKHNTNSLGFTLIELLIAMAITSIVSAGIFFAYRSQQQSQMAQQQIVEMQQNLRAALYIMTSEIRMAGYDPDGNNNVGITEAGTGNSSSDKLQFGFVEPNSVNSPPIVVETREYYLYDSLGDGTIDLGRKNGGNLGAIAENIAALQFTYFGINNTPLTAPINLSDIRSVNITITATTDANELDYTDGSNRTLTATVKCRNLGL